jgi:hypothetical protein
MNETVVLSVAFERGVGKYSSAREIFAEGSPLKIEGFPAQYVGWTASVKNGDKGASFKIGKDGCFTIPLGSPVLKEGVITVTLKRFEGGAVVDFANLEPLTLAKDNDVSVLAPTLSKLFEKLDYLTKKVQLLEDMHLGFDLNV